MKTLKESLAWANAQIGKSLDWDKKYGAQCVDFIRYYVDFLGYPQPPGVIGAKELWTVTWSKDFTKTSTAKPGDIAVFSDGVGVVFGHTSVVVSVGSSSFTSIDQNWVNSNPKGSPAAKVLHNYNAILGFIRPKFGDDMLTDGNIDGLTRAAFGRPATIAEKDKYRGKRVGEFIPYLFEVAQKQRAAEEAKLKACQAGQLNKDGVVNYIQANLK